MPVEPPATISVEEYIELMSSDKKAKRGKIRFIVLNAIGEAVLKDDIDMELLTQTLEARDRLCV